MVIKMHAKDEFVVIRCYGHVGSTICVKLGHVIMFDSRQAALPLKGGMFVERFRTRKTQNS